MKGKNMKNDMTIKEINEKYIALAMNRAMMADGSIAKFILYAQNWNDFDNDHYVLCSEIGDRIAFDKVDDLKEVNNVAQNLSGNYTKMLFTKDPDGEIQGDIFGKVIF